MRSLLAVCLGLTLWTVRAEAFQAGSTAVAKDSAKAKPAEDAKPAADEEKPIVTVHGIDVAGRRLEYTATTGFLPIKNSKGETEAKIFYMAYTASPAAKSRPLLFSFNGGPGSSSVWLHLGALGPRIVVIPDDATFPAPPYKLEDNPHTWLDQCDIVFIDPVGTGYSRASKPELNQKFHGLRGDIESVGEFIRLYLTRNDRWTSPLYVVGESYGTTRAAGLSNHLLGRGIALSGVILISTVLDFQTLDFGKGNDLPYVVYLPTYTATAWYHRKLATDLQADLRKTLAEAEAWAEGDYRLALAKGDALSDSERKDAVAKLARYSGLRPEFVDQCNLRIDQGQFCKELLRGEKRSVGRLDSRYKGIDAVAAGESPDRDPSMTAIRPPYTSTFADYVRSELGYKSDVTYHILGSEEIGRWDWGPSGRGYPETSSALRDALSQNTALKVLVCSGYYDLATPYKGTAEVLAHMGLDATLRKNISNKYYEAGHMMYVHSGSLKALKRDFAEFIDATKPKSGVTAR